MENKVIQLEHTKVENCTHNKEIIVIADSLRSPENVGMLFRVSEAMGVKKVIVFGADSPSMSDKKVTRTARSTIKNLPIVYRTDCEQLVKELKQDGFHLLALEITNTAVPIHRYSWSSMSKIALFIGSERNGVGNYFLDVVNASVFIPMFGKNTSINVINALSMALYETVVKQ